MIIAIDGPAGAGKSTVSQRLAARLGFLRIDTGALYRTIALGAMDAGLSPTDHGLRAYLDSVLIEVRSDTVFLNGVDVSSRIRMPEVSSAASLFSAQGAVRERLLDVQRSLARRHDAVMDGRDIGTVVFPNADLKIYLTASVEARAERRLQELRGRGIDADLQVVQSDLEARDRADSERELAPLRQADDAVKVDATNLSLEEVVDACFILATERQHASGGEG